MSRISKEVSERQKTFGNEMPDLKIVRNFMNGISYKLDPIQTLKMIAASSIFGEPSYYREGGLKEKKITFKTEEKCDIKPLFKDMILNKTTTEVFEEAIDAALEYDFGATIQLAIELREKYLMRLNPQVIMVRAAIHPSRKEWTKHHKGEFITANNRVMKRGDEPATQLAYFIYVTGSKANMPSILKRSLAARLGTLTKYEVNKYKNSEMGMINTVRIVHANSDVLNELMETGSVSVGTEEKTWENLLSDGMSWKDLALQVYAGNIKLPAMALIRNLRNIFMAFAADNSVKPEVYQFFHDKLIKDVPYARQFPFRYKSAYNAIESSPLPIAIKYPLLDTLSQCVDLSIDNMPHLMGTTVCLTDNSGSAWGGFTSEFGSVCVANIDNLSSVIAAKASDAGMVVKFGDNFIEYPISRRDSVLTQVKPIDARGSSDVGGSTEGGIWKFMKKAITEKIHFDNLFIFSDQQAGTGGLYGTSEDMYEYCQKGYNVRSRMIDVFALINAYRKAVNPRLNVFSVQTAGYNNLVIPTMTYRTAMLTGWTGKEVSFAAEYIRQWDAIEMKSGNNM